MGFVDILKAFDSDPRKQIGQSLWKREIKKELRNNIKVIYEVTRKWEAIRRICDEGRIT